MSALQWVALVAVIAVPSALVGVWWRCRLRDVQDVLQEVVFRIARDRAEYIKGLDEDQQRDYRQSVQRLQEVIDEYKRRRV